MKVKTGVDVCVGDGFKEFPQDPVDKNKSIGLLVHPASVDSDLQYTQELFIRAGQGTRPYPFSVKALFAPEHGLCGTQEYMEGIPNSEIRIPTPHITYVRGEKLLPVYSLYGKTLRPTSEMLEQIDTVVIDLQDIGSRYYTFIWTMALTMQACAQYKKQVVVLDRPNPINGITVEGPVLDPNFSSFVGLYPIPVRHGMTIGELALMFNSEFKIGVELKVIKMSGWQRKIWFDETCLPWVLPSPNMPTLATATVYPGMCLLEGTNVSEGRGTTNPFELFGAQWIDPHELCQKLNKEDLTGVIFRPAQFITTKYFGRDEVTSPLHCKGAQLHITNRDKFLPFLTGVCVIKTIRELYPELFKWRTPPYEHEENKLPFDLLAGNSWLRKDIEQNKPLKEIQHQWEAEVETFKSIREQYLFY